MSNLMRFFKNVFSESDNASAPSNGIPATTSDQNIPPEATVTYSIKPGRPGQVKFQGSWWTARCTHNVTLMPGQVVLVVGRRNISLDVEPIGF